MPQTHKVNTAHGVGVIKEFGFYAIWIDNYSPNFSLSTIRSICRKAFLQNDFRVRYKVDILIFLLRSKQQVQKLKAIEFQWRQNSVIFYIQRISEKRKGYETINEVVAEILWGRNSWFMTLKIIMAKCLLAKDVRNLWSRSPEPGTSARR